MSQLPNTLRYSREHEWVSVENDRARIGITEFAQDELGDIVFVELPAIGSKLIASETFGTVESVKTVSDLFAPISGTVVEVNQALQNKPELINQSPYDQGWMIVVTMDDPSELDGLLDASGYRAHTED